MIIKPERLTESPAIPLYQFKKWENPDFTYTIKKVPKTDYEFVQRLERETRGATDIKTDKDWNTVKWIYAFLDKKYPHEFEEFRRAIVDIRRTRNKGGKSESGEIMYVGALPVRFHNVIRSCFPEQEFNKPFIWKLVRKLPILKVTGELN